ncbi:3'(2'),5'-bisphosphate nucleotidase CysQ [Psychroserpens sp.]|uniref:3'(2'),5'-bisphosphate nucleotidase CysQ n=1 Tax=Psychroserpens sp. TaxID=2020870 RepID=UPI001B22526E|nr:3'(2'),5'-bisphosphate nucleotidase CysQ [Psychroserpens sp.]MBO6605390.1 3'(2'),5'-bisphosphate nucleotidase CysQ [Psychroserpens sp.]MBO6630166.1 3'(2'),5'-bisphosphate nucleotidase CysQ [Psychroserpens sp.]MBO6653801.1 3'(2'),5'-bisphosphate nucleotidase CysQ [Psychroserpens sp.]MBO6682122.1 3'(2'),5'-bisphosphate nucleotidase CysQ [Psychroserpens sp.]MBO6748764.1 3'(2'),5'-bisphosphate nucleotidase CysQ [Psychroserpens sp.]
MSFDLTAQIPNLIECAYSAGQAILEIYNSDDFNIEHKEDNSPLTIADRNAHDVIVSYLKTTNLPILSEEGEGISYEIRKNWNLFWMVDPLDGTKEFIKRNGEFTVNIALIQNQKPIFGIVYAPVLDKMFIGDVLKGAKLIEKGVEMELINSSQNSQSVRIVASRSHLNSDTETFINKFEQSEIVSMGSSLKFMVIAEGKADVYPRFAPTMEWDTAAAHAVLNALGIKVNNNETGNELLYNKEDLLNPHFLVNNLK